MWFKIKIWCADFCNGYSVEIHGQNKQEKDHRKTWPKTGTENNRF